MIEALWSPLPRPLPGPDAVTVGAWAPTTPIDLTLQRLQLADALGDTPGAAGSEEGVERLLLAFEELASNALRHGRAPVRVAVTAFDGCWLLEVSDAAADRPPSPAHDRDPAQGGLGLPLVARISGAHGWQITADRKYVWARIDRDLDDPGAAERLVGVVAGFTGALGFAPTSCVTGPVGRLPRDLVTSLFAVVGEALTNVARHAHAQSAGVDIAVTATTVTARVVDDGIGLAAAPRDGGLADLRRRAAWHGGTLTVGPGELGGTRLTWTVPHHLPSPSSG